MTKVHTIGYVPKNTRWTATVTYQVTETETRTETHHIMELRQLQELIERGPSFCAIADFRIEYMGEKYTIEEGMKL